jgi:hypothetical protein
LHIKKYVKKGGIRQFRGVDQLYSAEKSGKS